MTSKRIERKEKVYFLSFLVSFGTWVIVLCLTCFPSGALAVSFSSTTMLILLMVSGGIATVSGADYLRVHFRSEYMESVQTPKNQNPVLQDYRSNIPKIEEPQGPSTIVEPEESPQDVFEQTSYEASRRSIDSISFEIDRWKRIHYRDVASGKFVKKNLASPLANIQDIENLDHPSILTRYSKKLKTTRKPIKPIIERLEIH